MSRCPLLVGSRSAAINYYYYLKLVWNMFEIVQRIIATILQSRVSNIQQKLMSKNKSQCLLCRWNVELFTVKPGI